jgi:hypothetical protein
VCSVGCSTTESAIDLRPSPTAVPSNWSKTETLAISALSALLAARTSFSAGVSAATTKAKSRSMGW